MLFKGHFFFLDGTFKAFISILLVSLLDIATKITFELTYVKHRMTSGSEAEYKLSVGSSGSSSDTNCTAYKVEKATKY